MTRISSIALSGAKRSKQEARELVGVAYDPLERISTFTPVLKLLSTIKVGDLDRKVKHGEDLSFDEAFVGICTVLAATNRRFYTAYLASFEAAYGSFSQEKALAIASAFLNLMAAKESFRSLTAEEIAGMAAAGGMDTVVSISLPCVVETCGMGGDRGLVIDGASIKTINASTLSALVLAGLGLPAVKHGSYGNTSAVGSTEAIESFGALTSMVSEAEVCRVIDQSGFCFFDAHWCKTIHDLSHLLMMETVNHVIGPMTPPLAPSTMIHKVMGVNEKVHPETMARAYTILSARDSRRVGGVVIVSGLDAAWEKVTSPLNYGAVKRHTILDEASPFASVVAVAHGSEYRGTCIVRPEDFGTSIEPMQVFVPNDAKTIRRANIEALQGNNRAHSDYLGMNAALGLFAAEYAHAADAFVGGQINGRYLRECFNRCREAIVSQSAYDALERYVTVSGGTLVCE